MSDTDYIPDAGRDDTEWDQIERSHAVADSIAGELAAALRIDPTLDHSCGLEGYDDECDECNFIRASRAALARFDATIGKTGASDD